MTDERVNDGRRDPRTELPLAAEDAAFVRRLADAYAPPAAAPQERVAFRAALDRRLERERRVPWLPALGGVAAAALALALVLGAPGSRAPAPSPAPPTTQTRATPEEALLALAALGEDAGDEGSESLPADYEAIADLFLGEV